MRKLTAANRQTPGNLCHSLVHLLDQNVLASCLLSCIAASSLLQRADQSSQLIGFRCLLPNRRQVSAQKSKVQLDSCKVNLKHVNGHLVHFSTSENLSSYHVRRERNLLRLVQSNQPSPMLQAFREEGRCSGYAVKLTMRPSSLLLLFLDSVFHILDLLKEHSEPRHSRIDFALLIVLSPLSSKSNLSAHHDLHEEWKLVGFRFDHVPDPPHIPPTKTPSRG